MKLNIIFCIPELLIGGAEVALCELLLALNKLNLYKISVIVKNHTNQDRFDGFFKDNNITIYNASLKWCLFKFIKKPLQSIIIKRILSKYDVIVDFKYTYFSDCYNKIDQPKLCWLHCGELYLDKKLNAESLELYDKIICVSKSLSNYIQNHYPNIKSKSASIYNPVNYDEVLKKSNLSLFETKQPYFVAVQRLDKYEKDVATIIRAFNRFAINHPNYYLYIVGDGELEYKKFLESICESKNIIFTGALKNSYAIIKNAEALILSSTREIGEGMPVVLQEAHALGSLAISSNVPSGPPEILMNGDAGFLFEQGNSEELAEVLETVIQNKELCQKKIDCATKNLHRFDPEVSAQAFVKVIESLNQNK